MPTKRQLHRQWEIDFEFPDLRRDGDPLKLTFQQAESRRKELFGATIKPKEIRGADFSEDGLYRFSLWRIWDESKPLVMFVGLNPSTANADTDDATIRRVRAIATNLGYGGFYMCNCFAYISTNPDFLKMESLEAMMRNATIIRRVSERCKEIIFAWGNFDIVRTTGTDKKLIEAFPNAKALHINKNGSPKHPLYCRTDTKPIPYLNNHA